MGPGSSFSLVLLAQDGNHFRSLRRVTFDATEVKEIIRIIICSQCLLECKPDNKLVNIMS